MQTRFLFSLLCAAALTGLLLACSGPKPTGDEPWAYSWPASGTTEMDGRDLLGVYDIKDPQTREQFQVFLLYDNAMRDGVYDASIPFTVTAFYTTDGETWNSRVAAQGSQCLGFTERGRSDTCVVLNAEPYYAEYTADDHPLREQVHQPRPVTLTIQDGVPDLNMQGPPVWAVQTRRVPYNQHGIVFTGTVKTATAWGFASFTEELPMTYYYLVLDRPVAFDSNLSEIDRVELDQRELQIAPRSNAMFDQLSASVGQRVTIVGDCFHSHTAHHQRSVVISADMLFVPQTEP